MKNRRFITMLLMLGVFYQMLYADNHQGEALFKRAEACYNGTDGEFMNREKAFQLYEEAANLNYMPALLKMQDLYKDGVVVDKDTVKIVYWTRRAAEQNEKESQNRMGVYYADGRYVKQDYEQSIFWLTKAAEQGNATSMNNLGIVYALMNDSVNSYKWYRKGAESNFAKSQLELADMFLNGNYVRKDPEQGVYWMQKAAENGNGEAQNKLGVIYDNGKYVSRDYEKANYWYNKAIENGISYAYGNLGINHMYGHGLPVDYRKAVDCFARGIEKGNVRSYYYLGKILYEGEGGIEKDPSKGLEYLQTAAKKGDADAKKYLEDIAAKLIAEPANQDKKKSGKKKTSVSLNGVEVWHN